MSDEPNLTQEAAAPESTPAVTLGDAPAAPAPVTKPSRKPGVEAGGYFWGTGRRKRSIARVRIRPGSGQFLVNDKAADTYFCADRLRLDVVAPLKATKSVGKYDVFARVHGGGQTGQAGRGIDDDAAGFGFDRGNRRLARKAGAEIYWFVNPTPQLTTSRGVPF